MKEKSFAPHGRADPVPYGRPHAAHGGGKHFHSSRPGHAAGAAAPHKPAAPPAIDESVKIEVRGVRVGVAVLRRICLRSFGAGCGVITAVWCPPARRCRRPMMQDLVLPPQKKWISHLQVERYIPWARPAGAARGLVNAGNTW